MKQLLAIVLFFSVSCQTVAKLGVIAWFTANRDYVATELCENRNAPEKKCAGKCYLKKQLNKIEQGTQDSKQTPDKKHKTELPEYLAITTEPLVLFITITADKYFPDYNNRYYFNTPHSIFHPPPAC